MKATGLDAKAFGTHIELVRELGLDRRIRRANDYATRRVVTDVVVGTVLGCSIFGILIVGNLVLERLLR